MPFRQAKSPEKPLPAGIKAMDSIVIQPTSKEILERAVILGYLPEEWIGHVASLLEQLITNGPEIRFGLMIEVPYLDHTMNNIDDASAARLLHRLFPNATKKVQDAIIHSKATTAWIKRNEYGSKNFATYEGRFP